MRLICQINQALLNRHLAGACRILSCPVFLRSSIKKLIVIKFCRFFTSGKKSASFFTHTRKKAMEVLLPTFLSRQKLYHGQEMLGLWSGYSILFLSISKIKGLCMMTRSKQAECSGIALHYHKDPMKGTAKTFNPRKENLPLSTPQRIGTLSLTKRVGFFSWKSSLFFAFTSWPELSDSNRVSCVRLSAVIQSPKVLPFFPNWLFSPQMS